MKEREKNFVLNFLSSSIMLLAILSKCDSLMNNRRIKFGLFCFSLNKKLNNNAPPKRGKRGSGELENDHE